MIEKWKKILSESDKEYIKHTCENAVRENFKSNDPKFLKSKSIECMFNVSDSILELKNNERIKGVCKEATDVVTDMIKKKNLRKVCIIELTEKLEKEDVFKTNVKKFVDNYIRKDLNPKSKDVQINKIMLDNLSLLNPIVKNIDEEKKKEYRKKLIQFLSRPDFQKLMRDYYKGTDKNANRGLIFTKDFSDWIIKNPNIKDDKKIEYLEKIDEVNQKDVIRNIIVNKIENKTQSQREIAKKISSELSLKISPSLVAIIAKKILPNEQYVKRFPQKVLDYKTKEAIKKDIITSDLDQHKIAEKNEVSSSTVRNFALEILTEEEYKSRFPHEIDIKVTRDIESEIINSDLSLGDIAKKHNVSPRTVSKIASNILTDEEYRVKFFPTPETSKEVIEAITDDIMTSKLSQREIAKKRGSTHFTISKIAKRVLSEKEYTKRFPAFKKIDDKIRDAIKKDIITTSKNQRELAIEHNVSTVSVANIAREILAEEEYKERFPYEWGEVQEQGFLFDDVGKKILPIIYDDIKIDYRIYLSEAIFGGKDVYIVPDGALLGPKTFKIEGKNIYLKSGEKLDKLIELKRSLSSLTPKDFELYPQVSNTIDFYFLRGGSGKTEYWGDTKVTFNPVQVLINHLLIIAKKRSQKRDEIKKFINKIYDIAKKIDNEEQKLIT